MLIADAGREHSLEDKATDRESLRFASKAVSFAAQAYQAHVPVSVQLRFYGAAKDLEAAAVWPWHHVPAVYRDRYSIIQGTGWAASKGTQVWLLNNAFKGDSETAVAMRGWELAAVWFASAAAFEAATAVAHFAADFKNTYKGDFGRFLEVRKRLLAAQNIPKAVFGMLTWGLNLGLDKTELVPASTAIHFTGIPFSYEQTRFNTLIKGALDRGESGWRFALSYARHRPSEYATQIGKYATRIAGYAAHAVPATKRLATTTAALILGA